MRKYVLLLLFLAGCGHGSPTDPGPVPDPTPTPTPTPPPVLVAFPLRVAGSRFVDAAGQPFRRWGAINVDSTRGWPLVSDEALQEMASYGANWTHVRLGPQSPSGPDSQMSPEYGLSEVARVASSALGVGIQVEVDVVDGWVLKHGYNYFGWDRSISHYAPSAQQLEWVRRVASTLVGYTNVSFQVSNESFDIGGTAAWEFGIRDQLRRYAPGFLISTNAQKREIENGFDYVNRHSRGALSGPISGKPTGVNESGEQDALSYEMNLKASIASGTYFDLWRGETVYDDEWKAMLAVLKRVKG